MGCKMGQRPMSNVGEAVNEALEAAKQRQEREAERRRYAVLGALGLADREDLHEALRRFAKEDKNEA